RRKGELLRRDDILVQVFGYHFEPGTNLVSVHIANLRKKLRDAPIVIDALRGRVALWMVAAVSLSLALFTAAAYVVVRIEENVERGDAAVADAETRRQVFTALALAAPIGLALSIAGALWLSRRALAPVDRMIAAARNLTIQSLDRRIDVPERNDELHALAVALNDALDRLERGHRALAMFAADASHELRTPLAAICSELEVALRRPRS